MLYNLVLCHKIKLKNKKTDTILSFKYNFSSYRLWFTVQCFFFCGWINRWWDKILRNSYILLNFSKKNLLRQIYIYFINDIDSISWDLCKVRIASWYRMENSWRTGESVVKLSVFRSRSSASFLWKRTKLRNDARRSN